MPIGGWGLFTLDLLATFSPYVIVVLSLNLNYGYGGIPDFGKALAVLGGAFVAGYLPGRILVRLLGMRASDYISQNIALITRVNEYLQHDILLSSLILVLTLVVAMAVGAFFGIVASLPAIRLRAEFLAMTLLAVAEVFEVIGRNYRDLIGGSLGVAVPDPFVCFGDMRLVAATLFMATVAVLVFIYQQRLVRSPLGRMLRAIRDDENAALALGIDVTRARIKVMAVSSAIAALGGALYSLYTVSAIATAFNRVSWTFWPWVMVILGGVANNWGAVTGTFVFVFVRKLIIYYKDVLGPYVPFDVVWLDPLLLGLAIILVILYKPDGLIPEKPVRTIDFGKFMKRMKG